MKTQTTTPSKPGKTQTSNLTVDPRHSGPPIFGSIIKDPPVHHVPPDDILWFTRCLMLDLEYLHESVRYAGQEKKCEDYPY